MHLLCRVCCGTKLVSPVRVGLRLVSYVPRKKSYYEILNVDPQASNEEIKHAFVRLTREIHPDSASPSTLPSDSTERFMKLKEAYDFLRKPEKRKEYDREQEWTKRASKDMFYESTHDDNSQTLDLNLRGPGYRPHPPHHRRPPSIRARAGIFYNPSKELENEKKTEKILWIFGGVLFSLIGANIFYVTFFMQKKRVTKTTPVVFE